VSRRMSMLLILNDPPYGTKRYHGLRKVLVF
jgi:hypothetical protein